MAVGHTRNEIVVAERTAKRIRLRRQDSARYREATSFHVMFSKVFSRSHATEPDTCCIDDDDEGHGWL